MSFDLVSAKILVCFPDGILASSVILYMNSPAEMRTFMGIFVTVTYVVI